MLETGRMIAEAPAKHVLVAKDLSLEFGGLQVLRGLSLAIHPGERVTVIGPNGAGKTTFFNVLSGLLRPREGQIVLNGRDVTSMSAYRRARLGLGRGFQITNLFPDLSIIETALLAQIRLGQKDLVFYRAYIPSAADLDRLNGMLATWGFQDTHRRAAELSYGDQRKLDICLALLMNPTVLLLDEPTAGLSGAESGDIVQAIHNLPRSLTCITVTHDLRFGFDIADRVVGLHQGQIVTEGSPEEVQADELLRKMYF
jgi:branched-chain amino acid transport system ATP-binding protein